MRDDEAFVREHWHGVVFEPEAYEAAVGGMLAETGCCMLLKGVAMTDAQVTAGHVTSLRLSDGRSIAADAYVDATGDALLARA
jgi:hypothetical protein